MKPTERYVSRGALSIAFVRDAIVTAPTFNVDRTFTGGVYGPEGLIAESRRELQKAIYRPVDPPEFSGAAPVTRLDGLYLFGGWLNAHFGHFMLEATCRLWMLPFLPSDVRVIYHPFLRTTLESVLAIESERAIMAALGIVDRIVVLEHDVIVDRLFVPAPAFRINNSAHVAMNDVFDAIARRAAPEADIPRAAEKLYLSRRLLPENRPRPHDEGALEAVFARRGFRIVHPESLPFSEQVRLTRRATVLAGGSGSALHLVAFARPGTVVLELRTRDQFNQPILNELRAAKWMAVNINEDDSVAATIAALEKALSDLDL